MNDSAIFIKTTAGEEAVRDRTRLVQRNLRMALILVDGIADVADLRRRAGDAVTVDSALVELEGMGLIESLDAHVARGIQSRAGPPTLTEVIEPADLARPNRTPPDVIATSRVAATTSSMPEAVNLTPEAMDSPPIRSLMTSLPDWWERMRTRRVQKREEAVYEKAYGQDDNGANETLPSRHTDSRRRKFKPGPVIAVALTGALVLAVFRIVLYPYEEYRPGIEARLSRMLGDEVRIGNVRVGFMPLPVIVLEQVTVGTEAYALAESVRLAPEFGSLFEGRRFRQIRVEGLLLREPGLDRLARWFRPDGMEQTVVSRIDVQDLSLDMGWTKIDGLRGSAEIDPQRGFSAFTMDGMPADFRAQALPGPAGLIITVRTTAWKVPLEPALHFTALELRGVLSPGRFAIEKIDGRAYDGVVSGKGVVAWTGSPTLSLDLNLQHIGAGKLLAALNAPPLLEGETRGQIQVTSDAPSRRWLDRPSRLDGQFSVRHGSLRRIDLAEVLRPHGAAGSSVRGGSTGFEEFAGTLAMDSGTLRFTNLRLASGRMRATGQASISRQSAAITGAANVELRSSAAVIRSPVAISGNGTDPQLKLGR